MRATASRSSERSRSKARSDSETDMKRFPPGFVWGVATAAYQIEGAAREDGRGESIWDRFCRTPGAVERGETGDVACDHYHRWREDLDLIRSLGVGSYRFSIAWPRIQPDGAGAPSPKGLDFYRRLVAGLRERGIAPMATLYHWDLPQKLQDKGGWVARDTTERFAEFARTMYDAIGDGVAHWVTHNEPWCAAFLGHWHGVHAPGTRDLRSALIAAHHLLLSHGLAVRAHRDSGADGDIGIVLNLAPDEPASSSDADRAAARASDGHANRWFIDPIVRARYPADMVSQYEGLAGPLDFVRDGDLEAIAAPIDYLGVNYYSPRIVRAAPERPLGWAAIERGSEAGVASAGWERMPDGLTRLLVRLRDEYGPLRMYVTENGYGCDERPDADGVIRDDRRVAYLRAQLAAAHDAITQGVDLRGYHLWSLLDNFEWAFGYRMRFGAVYVDYPTQRRIPKTSASFYSDVVRRNALD
jgi:beta-glucosidase